jgi:hypothetical protein
MLLVGKGGMRDYAVNEDVELTLATSPGVHVKVETLKDTDKADDFEAAVTNANPWPISFEGTIMINDGQKLERPSARLARKFGRPTWNATVPANGEAKLRYRIVDPD